MTWRVVGVVAVSVAAVVGLNAVFAPLTVLGITLAFAVGVVVHELVHYAVAHAVGADDVRFVFDGQPEVRYRARPWQIRAVNLAPAAVGGLLLVAIGLNQPGPLPTLAAAVAFALGLIGFSKADWSVRHATASQ